ncbi:disease resistance protein RPV1-like [Bidens hawaiensis]|uniref:disease resistance protein RPV1-like n=1 Tax=Bidens hawaiensis TaxID=980011 RepID=UPI00404904B3
MAYTSVSSIQKSFKYDVFLSFRGEDTRTNFVDHLYHALHSRGITTYKDDERIEKGKKINNQLMRSIEESRFHIVVFSKNYASSSWCLDELVKIMECQRTSEQTAYPVFYDVEPTEVHSQSGSVGEAFAKHVEKEAAERWRDALKEAACLAGWELKNTVDGHEAKFIQLIVKDILLKPHFINSSVDAKLVGMEDRVKNVVSSLEIDSDDVCMVGIKGIGGGGKTTLAQAVFDHISDWFEGKSFVENVREVSKDSFSGLKELQKQVYTDLFNDQSIHIQSVAHGKTLLKKMMCSRKVLLALDDVDHIDQLEALAGEPSWFMPGSKVIITSRDEQVLKAHRVNFIHDVCLLSNEEAACLFSRYAIGKEIPIRGYEELSRKVVKYAAGLPLTIKVLGSFLCDRTESEWEHALKRLRTIPLKETLKKLEISYDGLEDDYKEIFLDVACILKGMAKKKAIRLLESCGFHAELGLRVLEQKSLITISYDGHLQLHDHLEELGMNIVRRLHPDKPYRHNRLWIKKEIEDILVNDLGTCATRSVKLLYVKLHSAMIMKGLRKMNGLRFLYVDDVHKELISNEVDQYLPNTLQRLHWSCYPFQCLPKTFQANKLVYLDMQYSGISQLWEGGERKVLDELRFLNLNFSPLSTFDLGLTPYLEELDLSNCYDLVELNMPYQCPKLKFLKLSGCKLSKFNLGLTPYLEELDLNRCYNLVELNMPNECPKLKFLKLIGSQLTYLNLGLTPYLEELDLGECNAFVELNMPYGCPKLKFLNLNGSKLKNFNLGLTPQLEMLNLEGCNDFLELNIPVECPNLKILTISYSKVRNLNLGMVRNLKELNLGACNYFEELNMPTECIKLKFLHLGDSNVKNLNLGMTPHLEILDLGGCYFLEEIYAPVGCLKNLVYLNLTGCQRFKDFVNRRHELGGLGLAATLALTAESVDICPLHPKSNLPKFQFKCKYIEHLPSSSGNIEKLLSFGLCACTNPESFSAGICGLQHLRVLTLVGSIPEVPNDLYQLVSLNELHLWIKEIKYLPDSICMLKHLKILQLKSCWVLEQLPKDLGRLERLEELSLTECISLQAIPNSICKLKCLKYLCLPYCIQVEKLPEDLGCLECLKLLNIEGAGITRLPRSIYQLKDLKFLNLGSSKVSMLTLS